MSLAMKYWTGIRRTAYVFALVCLLLCRTISSSEKTSHALFVVEKDAHCGYINERGQLVIEPVFEDCRDFSEDLAPVEVDKKWGFIDESGKIEIQPQFGSARIGAISI
jgi:hypothetical protein